MFRSPRLSAASRPDGVPGTGHARHAGERAVIGERDADPLSSEVPPPSEAMPTIDVSHFQRVLEQDRTEVIHQLRELGATESGDLTEGVEFGDGFADAGAATAERTETLGLVEALKTQLDGIETALARIVEGGYGRCASCGKEIPVDRLEARPESVDCVDCKSKR